MARLTDRVVTALFLLIILLPGGGWLLGIDPTAPPQENRPLAPPPRLSLEVAAARTFPAAFTRYFKDHFGFRSLLGQAWGVLQLRVLSAAASDKVQVGQEGWLFLAREDGGLDLIDGYRRARPFAPGERERLLERIARAAAWCAQHHAQLLVAIAPNKGTIYPEHMPPRLAPLDAPSRLDELVAAARGQPGVPLLDLRPALQAARRGGAVYDRTDTHWNPLGAFAAAQAIFAALAPALPALAPLEREDFVLSREPWPGDLADMLQLPRALAEVRPVLRPRPDRGLVATAAPPMFTRTTVVERAAPLPRVVVLHDSFGVALLPFLAQRASRLTSVYYGDGRFDPALLEAERPDAVVVVIAERALLRPLAQIPFLAGP